ncbi:hypothetical protein [Parasulfitobacter algicola]|uniref:Uncharacterized protein n=1 Tax=Parasulfitobacter algicola TaxID=2614809 RepID=A0ABX2IMS1_9RHOB|nr:hypothetical protein [Sulfitobacter algicola]NSX54168.1 hypothetical protein [Sulfitobacter algicola]
MTEYVFSKDFDWSLRALAQDAETQLRLYGGFWNTADDLASDYELALRELHNDVLDKHPEISVLDQLLLRKSGIEEFWTIEALRDSEFWHEVRDSAKKALKRYGIPVTAPEPRDIQIILIDEKEY